MSLAAQIAVQVDRLVLGIYVRVGPRHRERLKEQAADMGIPIIGALPTLDAELMSGPVPYEFVGLRLQYGHVTQGYELVDSLTSLGLLEQTDGQIVATERIKPFLTALIDARDDTAIWLVGDHPELVDRLNATCQRVSVNAPGELLDYSRHVIEPEHPSARLLHRLMKVRYVRHQCHMDAWRAAGLEADHMPAFTALWNGDDVEPSPELDVLIERGLATAGPALTDDGREMRDRIESETNTCAQAVFDRFLTTDEQSAFLSDLQSLQLPD